MEKPLFFAGGAPKMLYIGPVKAGIVAETALGINVGSVLSCGYQLPGLHKPLDGDVLPNSGPGGTFKQSAQLRLADIEILADILQVDRTGQVFVDVANNSVRQRIHTVVSIFFSGNVNAVHFVE